MKLNKALSTIFPAEVFKNTDLAAVLSASGLAEFELPDEVMNQFSNHYLTKDRALNDPELVKSYKSKAWANLADSVEDEMKNSIAGQLPEEFKTKYFAAEKIYDKVKILGEAYRHVSEKGSGEDVKTLAEKHRKQVADLHEKIQGHEAQNKKLADEFATKETGIKINYALRSKLTDLIPKLDPNFVKTEEQKAFLIDSTIHGLQSNYLLEFDKDNPQSINFLQKDRNDVYEGNKKVTLDDYILRKMEPYIVKNNGGENPKPEPKPVIQNQGVERQTLQQMIVNG